MPQDRADVASLSTPGRSRHHPGIPRTCSRVNKLPLACYGAHTFWGLLTRTAAIIAAHTLMRVCLAGQ